MTFILGNEFGRAVCKALGLDANVTGDLDIRVPVSGPVLVTVRQYMEPDAAKTIAEEIEKSAAAVKLHTCPRCGGKYQDRGYWTQHECQHADPPDGPGTEDALVQAIHDQTQEIIDAIHDTATEIVNGAR